MIDIKKKILKFYLFLMPLLDILSLRYSLILNINVLVKLIFGFFIIFTNTDKREMLLIIIGFLVLKLFFNKKNFLEYVYIFDFFLGSYEIIKNKYKIKSYLFYLLSLWMMVLFLLIKNRYIFFIMPVIYFIPICVLFLRDNRNVLNRIIYFVLLTLTVIKIINNPYIYKTYMMVSSYGISYLHLIVGFILLIYFAWNKKLIPLFSSLLFLILNAYNFNYLAFPYLSLLVVLDENIDKDILLISNMYPSKRNKHYGSFVKNVYNILSKEYDVTLVKMSKHSVLKLFGYFKIYFLSIFYPMIYNYRYMYVHFISHSSLGAIISKKLSKTKIVFNAHGNDVIDDPKNVKRSKYYLKYADKVIVPSNYFKDVICDYGIDEKNIFVYPSGGVDTKKFKKLDKIKCQDRFKLDHNLKYIGYVGRIEKDKGLDLLIKSFDKIKTNKMRLIIVGKGKEEEKIRSLISDLKLEKYIIHYDFMDQDDLPYLYNALDVFVFPTHMKSESLGLVGLEAMACEVPVVGSDNYGVRDYLNKNNGFPFKPSSVDDLSKKIRLALKNGDKVVKNARNTSLKYDNEKTRYKIIEVFK